jgi:hypothetical protein
MNWEMIGAIGEIVGAGAVVISLLYLAVQVRGATRQARVHATSAASDSFNDILKSLYEDGEVADIFDRGTENYSALQGPEVRRFGAFMGSVLRAVEDICYKRLHGDLDDRVWHGYSTMLRGLMANPGAQAWWATRVSWYSDEFGSFVQGIITAAERQVEPQGSDP